MDELTALELSLNFPDLVISRSIEKACQQIGSFLSGTSHNVPGVNQFLMV